MSKTERKWTRKEHDYLLGAIVQEGNWFKIHRAIIQELGIETAAVLHWLIKFHERVRKGKGYKWDDGWFFCTVEKMKGELILSADRQLRIIKRLVNKGFIEMKKKGLPARRHVRIDAKKFHETVISWSENSATSDREIGVTGEGPAPSLVSPKPLHNRENIIREKENKGKSRRSNRRQAKDGFFENGSSSKLDNFCRHWGNRVRLAVREADPTCRMSRAKVETYAKDIRRWRLELKKSEEDIAERLEWYCEPGNYEDHHTPKIRQSGDLYSYFDRIRWAKERKEEVYEGNGEAEEPIPWDGCTEKQALTADVRDWLVEYDGRYDPQVRGRATDRQVEKALVALGREGEEVDRSIT